MGFSEIELLKSNNYYTVCNKGVYFKIGLREGRILYNLKSKISKEEIMKEENLSEKDFDLIIKELTIYGVIGEGIKDRKNILFYKIPLFSVDNLMEKLNNVFLSNKNINRVIFTLINTLIIAGFILAIINGNHIFKIESIKLHISQYIFLYFIFFILIFLHEFSHGLACKHYGGKVGKVGFILLLFNPAFYCDISGVRMFREKKFQIFCSLAGIYFNAFVFALFSLMYIFIPSNFIKSLIIVNLITIITNIIPFIRLDGYWTLSFALGIINMYKKSLTAVMRIGKKRIKTKTDLFLTFYGITTIMLMLGSLLGLFIGIIKLIKHLII